VHKFISIL